LHKIFQLSLAVWQSAQPPSAGQDQKAFYKDVFRNFVVIATGARKLLVIYTQK